MGSVVINEPIVVHELIDGEVVAIHNETGAYYSLRDSAAVVWQGLAAGWPTSAIVEWLGGDPALVERDVAVFVARLAEASLVVPGSAAPRPDVDVPPAPGSYAAPQIEAFTDMQDLLLLDPIHEVGEAGWPTRPGS